MQRSILIIRRDKMISELVKKYCRDFTKIENYEKAINDTTLIWDCHHRLETHNSDGERRLVDISRKELIALGMYYDRPPEELIFLTNVEHARLHHKGRPKSEEHNRKVSVANKGKKRSKAFRKHLSEVLKGKGHSEEWRKKVSEANKGRRMSEEWKRRISEGNKGKVLSEETKRKLSEANKGKKLSEETRRKKSAAMKGKHWKLVDGKRVYY